MDATEECSSGGNGTEEALNTVLQQKEHELHKQLHAKDRENAQLREQLSQLADDFRYNLSLIEDRDAELERFEASTDSLRAQLHEKEQQIASLQQQLNQALTEEAHVTSTSPHEHANRSGDHRGDTNAASSSSAAAAARQAAPNASSGAHYFQSAHAAEDSNNSAGDRASKERVEALSKEAESLHATVTRLCNENETLRANLRANDAERKATVAELEARIAAKESRIFELEDELHSAKQGTPGADATAHALTDGKQQQFPADEEDAKKQLAPAAVEQHDAEELRAQLKAAYEELGTVYSKLHRERQCAGQRSFHKHNHHHHVCQHKSHLCVTDAQEPAHDDGMDCKSHYHRPHCKEKKAMPRQKCGRNRSLSGKQPNIELRGIHDRLEQLEADEESDGKRRRATRR